MFQSESSSSHAPQLSSLVLVAPMPRRPIALVARRHHHRHTSQTQPQSHSRSSRAVSNGNIAALVSSASSPDSTEHASASQRAASPCSNASTVRLVAHPYSRAKTPSNVNAAATSMSLGLALSAASPPPRSRNTSREGLNRPHPAHRRPSLRDIAAAAAAAAAAGDAHADEPMPVSPAASPLPTSVLPQMDFERTPTKRSSRAQPKLNKDPLCNQDNSDQQPRSNPTIGATSALANHVGLNVSPASPTEQRSNAASSASTQLALAYSLPPASIPATIVNHLKKSEQSASIAPSPNLSESHSRSPTASPSPCPSPSLSALPDTQPDNRPGSALGDRRDPRKMGLPPMPTSPIPRKMTRNPFERYLSIGSAIKGSMTLHARLALAMAQSDMQCPSVIQPMESQASQQGEQADEEMATVEVPHPSSNFAVHRPALVRVGSSGSNTNRMDMHD